MTAANPTKVHLREVIKSDLDIFFEQQLDPEANHMAAFTAKKPADRAAFNKHWAKIMADDTIPIETILVDSKIAGYILCHGWFGEPELSYWIGKPFWGKGIATAALAQFLQEQTTRPLFARVAKDNLGSKRVLEKCGFLFFGRDRGYANARGTEIDEIILKLK
ncbi:MAG: N-acetyltransferase [Chloroflexi bacterium]|nr:MAG: N-acetyltransferase [Chloroflexota bacterium]